MRVRAMGCRNWMLLFTCVLFLTACERSKESMKVSTSSQSPILFESTMQTNGESKSLLQFITKKLSGEEGIFTNYKDTPQSADMATGHEMLSESAGLLLRYYALTKQKSAFQAEWERTKETFNLSTGFSYRFSPKQNKKYLINAAVDDLRIIRALYEMGDLEEANAYGARFYKYNIKNGFLYDFYDPTYKTTNDFITLCYIDLKTLELLPDTSKDQHKLIANMLGIIEKGYLSDVFPFYETRYSYKTNTYEAEKINTVESILTILSLAEVNKQNPASIHYLKEHVKAGTLYGQYDKTGKPVTDIQSTAIYAIAAMIGSQIGDSDLYKDSLRRMSEYQIRDGSSPLNGGFGYKPDQQAYSFDNLLALLAYTL